jgi:hypothetical protein
MRQVNPAKRLNHRDFLGGFFVFRDGQFPSYYGGVPEGRGGQFFSTIFLNLYGRLVHHYGWMLQA